MGGEECIYAMSTKTSAATAAATAATEIRRAGAASVQSLTPHDFDSHLVPENAMSRSNGPQ